MHVRMKDKGQVTIPAPLRDQIQAVVGDIFEASVEGGNIILRPQVISARDTMRVNTKPKGVDIGKWVGAGKGLFKTPGEADAFIRAERDQWE